MLLALTARAAAQTQTIPPPRLNAEERKRAQVLLRLVDEVFAQKRSAPQDVPLSWECAFIAADNGLVYVPYVVNIGEKFRLPPVAMYVRVVTKDARPADWDPSKTTTMRSYLGQMSIVNDTRDIRSGYVEATGIVAEDVRFFSPPADGRFMRGLWLKPGEYDVYVAMQEKAGLGLPKTAVLKRPLLVPDLMAGFSISSVLLADAVEPHAKTDQRHPLDEPFTIGGTRIALARSAGLRASGELTFVYYVYHPSLDGGGKPDLSAEYIFQRFNAGVPQMFMRGEPQLFNAQTLPDEFNPAVHQILGGEAVRLSSFPPGDYRLDVIVTDKVTGGLASASATFSLLGP